MAAGWEGLKATIFTLLDDTLTGVVSFGDRTIAVFQGAYDGAVAIWGSLPGAIGDFAFQAANGLISGVEAMLNGVVTRINSFIETLNAALALLPDAGFAPFRPILARAALAAGSAFVLLVAGLVVQRWCRVRADENDDDPRGPGVAVGLGPEDLDPA